MAIGGSLFGSNDYKPGRELRARLTEYDPKNAVINISVKDVNPNSFDGAELRHPVGRSRQAEISGTYGGGVFCRLKDDPNCMCHYEPGLFDEEFFIGDKVLIRIMSYDYEKKQIFGKLLSKM